MSSSSVPSSPAGSAPGVTGTARVKRGMAEMLKGGVIMDVINPEQAKIAEDAGAVAVMALERVPADIRRDGGVARMSDPDMIDEIVAAVFIPVSSTALIGVGHHDAGVASAVLNSSQQIGGSLGTALLNTVFASGVTAYLVSHVHSPAEAQQLVPSALIHGYHVAFLWGAVLLTAALVVAVVFVNAKKEDVPSQPRVTAPA